CGRHHQATFPCLDRLESQSAQGFHSFFRGIHHCHLVCFLTFLTCLVDFFRLRFDFGITRLFVVLFFLAPSFGFHFNILPPRTTDKSLYCFTRFLLLGVALLFSVPL